MYRFVEKLLEYLQAHVPLLPVVMGFLLCFVVAQSWRLVAG